MIQRTLEPILKKFAEQFPTVTIQGPRQSGKTTLAKMAFPRHHYVNLEDPFALELARTDYKAFFKLYPTPLIIDEIQLCPELLRAVQVEVDLRPQSGNIILTGSHQPLLRQGICESLAGRTIVADLLPLSIEEILPQHPSLTLEELLYRGFMPRIYNHSVEPRLLYQAYYQTYVERDVRQLVNLHNQNAFHVFLTLLAGRVGQLLNLHSMANDVGVSVTTLKQWISVLEASYIVFRLHPYYENLSRRLVKTPKLYFTEPGLAVYLLGITSPDQLLHHPMRGGLFENMVIADKLKQVYNRGERPQFFFYRDAAGVEVDLLCQQGSTLQAYEIKSAQTPSNDFVKSLEKIERIVTLPITDKSVIYAGEPYLYHDIPYTHYADIKHD